MRTVGLTYEDTKSKQEKKEETSKEEPKQEKKG